MTRAQLQNTTVRAKENPSFSEGIYLAKAGVDLVIFSCMEVRDHNFATAAHIALKTSFGQALIRIMGEVGAHAYIDAYKTREPELKRENQDKSELEAFQAFHCGSSNLSERKALGEDH